MVNQKKQIKLEALTELLDKNQNFVIIKYEKTAHTALEELRRNLKKTSSKLKVIKNSLLKKAVNQLSGKRKEFHELKKKFFPLKENSAVLSLTNDYTTGLSSFFKFAETNKTLAFKFGILDNKLYLSEEINHIAELPPREQIIAKIIESFKSPTSRLVYSMKFNINKLVYILKTKSTKS